jgi:uncharacterized protein (DUF305 family)
MSRFVTSRRALLVAPAIAAAITLAACGGDDDDDTASATTTAVAPATAGGGTPPASGAAAEFNDADVEFAQSMIAHHEQAIEMAEIAGDPTRDAGPEVVDLAARIEAAQDPEINTMTGWLTAWGQPVQMDTSGGHEMGSMTGMMSAEDMDALAALTGSEFDETWLTMMVEHHEGAIEMATGVQAAGVNPDVASLAEQIIVAQQSEVDEMNGLLAG